MGTDGEAAEKRRHGVVGMALQFDEQGENLLAGDGKGIGDELRQGHEHTEADGDAAAEPARNRDVALDAGVEAEGRDLAAGGALEKGRGGLGDHAVRGFGVVGAGEGDRIVKLHRQAKAVEAGAEIRRAGRNADRGAG